MFCCSFLTDFSCLIVGRGKSVLRGFSFIRCRNGFAFHFLRFVFDRVRSCSPVGLFTCLCFCLLVAVIPGDQCRLGEGFLHGDALLW
jgi:hypothetical protein